MAESVGPEVAVVGSLNLDLSIRVDRFPIAGETIAGTGLTWGGGGKGANQAVAAARLGRRVAMIGAVGADDAGVRLTNDLAASGVDIQAVQVDPENPTGTAVIEVDSSGENRIVVVAGANGALDQHGLTMAGPVLDQAQVVLVQFETPVSLVEQLPRLCPSATIVLNPAPVVAGAATDRLLSSVDYLIPNRHELAAMDDGVVVSSIDEMATQAQRILDRSQRLRAVVITLGADGVAVVGRNNVSVLGAMAVDAVDTTAAGDAFCAGFADGLLRSTEEAGSPDLDAVARWATRVAAVTVTRRGAQASLPTRDEVLSLGP